MLRDGAPPPTFRKPPPPPVPMPISHFLVRPRRRAAERTNAAIDASMRELAGVSRLGISPWSRDIRRTLTGVSKVNVWAIPATR